MKRVMFSTVLLMFAFTVIGFASPAWQWVTSDQTASYFFDKNSIGYKTSADKNIVIVNVKEKYSKEGSEKVINEARAKGFSVPAVDAAASVEYSTNKIELDLAQNKVKTLSSILYDKEGRVVFKITDFGKAANIDVKSDSFEEKLINGIRAYTILNKVDVYNNSNDIN
ncbi:hypothetical protein [Pectinatus haikarae]|uniref:hypothetical protein n=1 Tax=Pectinatus haikarae TaxID=349096 RepID=UPI0018C511F1|nr:hypothetical protein [Pectinatus haikarae]